MELASALRKEKNGTAIVFYEDESYIHEGHCTDLLCRKQIWMDMLSKKFQILYDGSYLFVGAMYK
jgi:hypothetical protein